MYHAFSPFSRDSHSTVPQIMLHVADIICRVKGRRLFLIIVPLVLAYRVISLTSAKRVADFQSNQKIGRNAVSQVSLSDGDAPYQQAHKKEDSSFEKILKSIQTSYSPLFKKDSILNGQQRNNHTNIYTRAFPRYQHTFPCYPPEEDWNCTETTQRRPAHEGLFYVKTYKTASTTVAGVAVRIALKAAERYNQLHHSNFDICKARFEHWPAFRLQYRMRKREESFLFAVLREPTRRAISMFFHFQVTRAMEQPLDSNFQRFLTEVPGFDEWYADYNPWGSAMDHYLHFLSLDGFHVRSEGKNSTRRRIQTVNKILNDFDFIGITERLDESLVALQMILGLKTSDILYYSAKNKGSWDDHGFYIQPSFVSNGMEQFFASEKWRELSKGDYLMYLAANASLDRTIHSLGREEFEDKLALFRYAKDLVVTNCTEIKLMYSAAGATGENDCLYLDAGCGNKCFNKLEIDFNI